LSGNRAFDLMRGEADLAVRVRETTEPDLVTRKICEAGWSIFASAAYGARKGTPPSAEDLRGHDVIAYDPTLAQTPGAEWLKAHAEGANVVLRANSLVAAMNAAIFGLGIAVIPCFLGDAEPMLQRISRERIGDRDVCLVVHPDLARLARIRAVMDFVL